MHLPVPARRRPAAAARPVACWRETSRPRTVNNPWRRRSPALRAGLHLAETHALVSAVIARVRAEHFLPSGQRPARSPGGSSRSVSWRLSIVGSVVHPPHRERPDSRGPNLGAPVASREYEAGSRGGQSGATPGRGRRGPTPGASGDPGQELARGRPPSKRMLGPSPLRRQGARARQEGVADAVPDHRAPRRRLRRPSAPWGESGAMRTMSRRMAHATTSTKGSRASSRSSGSRRTPHGVLAVAGALFAPIPRSAHLSMRAGRGREPSRSPRARPAPPSTSPASRMRRDHRPC